MEQNIIELNHVYKTYNNNKTALKNITLNVKNGELIYLLGHSGAGKSTLFKIISAQEKITSGSAKVLSHNLEEFDIFHIHHLRRQISLIFQDYKLISHLTAFDNITLPLKILNFSTFDIKEKTQKICEKLKITDDLLSETPAYLSGGEQQKIAIARAIIHEPKLILADEPTGNLDHQSSDLIFEIFDEIQKTGTALFIATHDRERVIKSKNKYIELHQGSILETEAGL